tara:strand:+ start:246 stop:2054 length:1809 start_codon:yes stop_codon:yes gene_type:complete
MFHIFAAETTFNGNPDNPTLGNDLEREVYTYSTFAELVKEAAFGDSSPDLVWSFKERCTSGIRVPQDHATIDLAKKWLEKFGGRNVTLYMDDDDGHIIKVPEDLPEDHATLVLAKEWLKNFKGRNVTLYMDDHGVIRVATETVTTPNTILLGQGEHHIDGNYEHISSAMNIVGDPGVARKDIVIMGGIWFEEGIPGICHLQHLTLRQAEDDGVRGKSSFTMDDVLVEQCVDCGVVAYATGVIGRCTNVEVRQCGLSGVVAGNGASITLIGAKTTVHHNCTKGKSGSYGLQVWDSSSFSSIAPSTIQLVSPLTKEEVSTDNGGDGNWRAETESDINQSMYSGQIKMITQAEFTTFIEEEAAKASRMDALIKSTFTVNVPEDGNLFEAVRAVKLVNLDKNFIADKKITIVVGKGEHQIGGDFLLITSATNIEGNPGVARKDIVIVGGIYFEEGIPGICHLQHLTLRQAILHGVTGCSSFTMDDVLVELCDDSGVTAIGTGVVGRCTNVEVRHCGESGVFAYNGGSIIFQGVKTKVHDNCTKENDEYDDTYGDMDLEYGLGVWGPSSTIQLVFPLTKEQVSVNNGGGGNWGAEEGGDLDQIKTID